MRHDHAAAAAAGEASTTHNALREPALGFGFVASERHPFLVRPEHQERQARLERGKRLTIGQREPVYGLRAATADCYSRSRPERTGWARRRTCPRSSTCPN